MMRELEIGHLGSVRKGTIDAVGANRLLEAITEASEHGQGTWLTFAGRRIAAIVPQDIAEAAEWATQATLTQPAGVKADD